MTLTLLFMTSHYFNRETDKKREQDKANNTGFGSADKHKPLQISSEDHTRESAETMSGSRATARITVSGFSSQSTYTYK